MASLGGTFGLTGGIASGKTTVAHFFEELGAKIIDADRLGHELVRAPLPAYREIVALFGREILDPSGDIDRRRLGALVFANARKLQELNTVLHPRIIERAEELADQYRTADPKAVVIVDAALIYEAGVADRFHKIIVTWCRPEQQVERLTAKMGISHAEAERRIAAQMPAEEKCRRADYIIDCSGAFEGTREQVVALYSGLKRLLQTP